MACRTEGLFQEGLGNEGKNVNGQAESQAGRRDDAVRFLHGKKNMVMTKHSVCGYVLLQGAFKYHLSGMVKLML